MIKISRGAIPGTLAKNGAKWLKALLEAIKADEEIPGAVATAYNQEDVKEQLSKDSLKKCMYCESKISHAAYEHIEHFRPKAKHKYPKLTFTWENLGWSCPVCNVSKSDEFDEQCAPIDPYAEDPSQFVEAHGPIVAQKIGNRRGELTCKLVKLNRPELIERRAERLTQVLELIERWHAESNGGLKDAIRSQIALECASASEYSFVVRAFVDTKLGGNPV
jgi:uncharacterized protein (TIGR02646 family)